MPVEFEKRTITGVELLLKCGPELREPASAVGVNVPLTRIPLACAMIRVNWCPNLVRGREDKPGLKPGGVEKAPCSVLTRVAAVSLVLSLVERGIMKR